MSGLAAFAAAALAAAVANAPAPSIAQTTIRPPTVEQGAADAQGSATAPADDSTGPSINFKEAPPGPAVARPIGPEPVKPESHSILAETAKLRLLDKMNGKVDTFEVGVGQTVHKHRLEITLRTCRTPPADEKEDAYAFLQIRDDREDYDRFDGWMFASSPALSAMDHQRYDVWVLSCSTSSGEASGDSAQKSE